jgi:hypothetical protein
MRRLHQMTDGTVFEADDAAFDDRGCLKDGYTLRVPMQFRDSNRGIAEAPRLRFADGRTDVPVGSRPGSIVSDASQATREQAYRQMCDELRNAWRQHAGNAAPGATVTRSDTAPRHPISLADAQAIRDAAYREMCHELANAWRRA